MDTVKWDDGFADLSMSIYRLLAPRVNVKGRMALILFLAVVWAFGWFAAPNMLNGLSANP